VGAGIDRALIHRQLNHVRFVDNWIDSSLHPRLEQRLQALAELIVQHHGRRRGSAGDQARLAQQRSAPLHSRLLHFAGNAVSAFVLL
jgi:hypothetical protein